MTILPRAASCQRPSADLLAQKLEACNLNKIFFPGYTVVACVRTRESLTLKLETTEPAICPKCGESCIKIHDTRYRLIRDAPFPGVTVVWLLVPIQRVRCNLRVVRNDFTGTCNVMFIGRPINDIRRNADDLIDSHVHFHAKVPGAALLS